LFFVYFFYFFAIIFETVIAQTTPPPWSEPACDPPDCNIFLPINIGGSAQSKLGALTLGSPTPNENYQFQVFGNSNLGNVVLQSNTSIDFSLSNTLRIGPLNANMPQNGMIKMNLNNGKGIAINDTGFNVNSYGVYAITKSGNAIIGLANESSGIGIVGSANTINGSGMAARFSGKVLFNKYNNDSNTYVSIENGEIKSTSLINSNMSGINPKCLYAGSDGIIRATTGDCGGLSGGNATYIPLWSSSSTIRNSILKQLNNNIGISGEPLDNIKLSIYDENDGPIINLIGKNNYKGIKISDNDSGNEQWFLGRDSMGNFVVRRDGGIDDIKINDSGNVTLNSLSGNGMKCLHVDNDGVIGLANSDCGSASLSGGATNYIPLWTSANTLATSSITQDSNGNITVNLP